MLQLSPKFSTMVTNKKDDTATNTQTPKNKEHPVHSKFKFQIQIAQNHTRGSERCEKDRTAINLSQLSKVRSSRVFESKNMIPSRYTAGAVLHRLGGGEYIDPSSMHQRL
jgi:hypothetical protein